MKFFEKKQFYIILFFVFIGFSIKIFGLYEISKFNYCNTYIEPHDSYYEIRAAEELINKNIINKIYNYIPNTAYKLFLNIFFLLFGKKLFIIRIAQIIFSSIVSFLLFILGKKIYNSILGIILIVLWSFSFDVGLYDMQILKYSLNLSFIIISIFLIHEFYIKHKLINFFGALFSIIILGSFRPIYFFLIFLLMDISLTNFKNVKINKILKISIFLLIPISIILWLNFASNKSKTHVGIHMYKGFNKESKGFFCGTPFINDNSLGHMKEAVNLSHTLAPKLQKFTFINNFWIQKTLINIVDNPFAALQLIFYKAVNIIFYNNWDDTLDILNLINDSLYLKLLFIKFHYLIPFAVIGFFCFFSKKSNYLMQIVNISFFLQFLSVVITCVTKRYQAQLTPYIIIYAGVGLIYLYNNIFSLKKLFLIPIIFFIFFIGFKINKDKKDIKILSRNSYYQIRIEKYNEAKAILNKYIQNSSNTNFQDIQQIHENFMISLSFIEAKEAISHFIKNNRNLENNELFWFYHALGDIHFSAKEYYDALKTYKKAYSLYKEKEILNKINTSKNIIFLMNNISSYN